MIPIADKVVALHDALASAAIPHAIGGAFALGYCVEEPRGTADIDVNLFVPESAPEVALRGLPEGIAWDATSVDHIRRDGQIRLWWESTPIDLFFNNHQFHDDAAARVRLVPFAGAEIPILDCADLAVFKAFFARSKDWVDIETMAVAGTLGDARARLVSLLGPDDPAIEKFDRASHPEPWEAPRRLPPQSQS